MALSTIARVKAVRRISRDPSGRPATASDTYSSERELTLATILAHCMDAMRQDAIDVDQVLAQYPDAADEIRALLDVAALLQHSRMLLCRQGVSRSSGGTIPALT